MSPDLRACAELAAVGVPDWAVAIETMSSSQHCTACGQPLPPGTPGSLCVRCLRQTEPDLEPLAADHSPPNRAAQGPSSAPKPGELAPFFPQLEILDFIGAGGMGVVYKARQPKLDRLVALKVLPSEAGRDPNFAERFAREARTLARLNHPGIVGIYDFGQAGPYYYLVLEYVDGSDVRRLIASRRLPAHDVLDLVTQICDALQFAHSQGVVHRDIKPGNILVDRAGRVKIADFGLAKLLGQDTADPALTGTHHVMGTPHYMAPEQREGSKTVDHRADIYSLGVVFYEMLTGELPAGRFAPPSEKARVDERVDAVVLRALEPEPERRYQSASDVKSCVQDIAAATPRHPRPSWLDLRAGLWPRLRSRIGIGVALLVLGVGIAAAWFQLRSSRAVLRETPPKFGHSTGDSRWFNYKLELPANHRITFWLEWWQGGQRTNRADFPLRETLATARGRPLEAGVDLILWHQPNVPGRSTNRLEWGWLLRGGTAVSEHKRLAADPFAGMTVRDSSYGRTPVHKLAPGQVRTLAVFRGGRQRLLGEPWNDRFAGAADVEMHLKARLEPVPEVELSDVPTAGPPADPRPPGTP